MKLGWSLMVGCLLTSSLAARTVVDIDVYGVDAKQAEQIKARYGEKLRSIEHAIDNAMSHSMNKALEKKSFDPDNMKEPKGYSKLKKDREQILGKIKQEYNLLYVDLSTFFYEPEDYAYTTMNVITQEHAGLLKYTESLKQAKTKRTSKDLIDKMTEFGMRSMMLFSLNKLSEKDTDPKYCPFYHCTTNFIHPELKPYMPLFKEGAVKENALILNTLKHETDSERRASAVFLIGYLNNPNQIVSLLMPYVQDSDPLVRNNAIRVIGETVNRAKMYDINLKPFFELLDSPQVTDRNKSLIVIYEAAKSPAVKKQILAQIGDKLLVLLRLKQPNNHLASFEILQRISGKSYGDEDYAAWDKWVAKAKSAA